MADELDALAAKLQSFADSLTPNGLERLMTELGVQAKKDMAEAVRADLGGDNRFSGWKRAVLNVGFEHTPTGITLQARRNSVGPFQVAEQGRSPSSLHGRTPRKLTWSDGVDSIIDRTPNRAAQEFKRMVAERFM